MFDSGWVLTLIASCSLSFRNQALIAQGLYTPTSLLVRRIRMDLWCFHQDYHSHYTTLYSHVRTKDSCRIRRMPPPALSLLTILLLHLAGFIRLHITKRCRSITVFSCSVGNTFACLFIKEPIIFLDKIFWLIWIKAVNHVEVGVTLVILPPFERVRYANSLFSHSAVLLILLILTPSHFWSQHHPVDRTWLVHLDINKLSSSTA